MPHGKQGSGGGFSGPPPPHGLTPTLHPKATKTPSYTKWFSYQPGETESRALYSQEPVSPGAVIAEAKKNTHKPKQNGGSDKLDCGCTTGNLRGLGALLSGSVEILAEEMSAELAKPAALRFNHPMAAHLVLPEGGLVKGARFSLVNGAREIVFRYYDDTRIEAIYPLRLFELPCHIYRYET